MGFLQVLFNQACEDLFDLTLGTLPDIGLLAEGQRIESLLLSPPFVDSGCPIHPSKIVDGPGVFKLLFGQAVDRLDACIAVILGDVARHDPVGDRLAKAHSLFECRY